MPEQENTITKLLERFLAPSWLCSCELASSASGKKVHDDGMYAAFYSKRVEGAKCHEKEKKAKTKLQKKEQGSQVWSLEKHFFLSHGEMRKKGTNRQQKWKELRFRDNLHSLEANCFIFSFLEISKNTLFRVEWNGERKCRYFRNVLDSRISLELRTCDVAWTNQAIEKLSSLSLKLFFLSGIKVGGQAFWVNQLYTAYSNARTSLKYGQWL